jgi:hypothetical protein
MRYSIILWKFAKWAQITFGAVATGNLLPFKMYFKKAKRLPFLMTMITVYNVLKKAKRHPFLMTIRSFFFESKLILNESTF